MVINDTYTVENWTEGTQPESYTHTFTVPNTSVVPDFVPDEPMTGYVSIGHDTVIGINRVNPFLPVEVPVIIDEPKKEEERVIEPPRDLRPKRMIELE